MLIISTGFTSFLLLLIHPFLFLSLKTLSDLTNFMVFFLNWLLRSLLRMLIISTGFTSPLLLLIHPFSSSCSMCSEENLQAKANRQWPCLLYVGQSADMSRGLSRMNSSTSCWYLQLSPKKHPPSLPIRLGQSCFDNSSLKV